MKIGILSFLMLMGVTLFAQEDVAFSISLSGDTIGVGDEVEVSFTLKNAQGAQFKAPAFEGFTILSGPNQSSSIRMVNGDVSRTQSFTYTISPDQAGTFTIAPASIVVGGKKLESNELQVYVVEGYEAPRKEKPASRNPFFGFGQDGDPFSRQAPPKLEPKKPEKKTYKL